MKLDARQALCVTHYIDTRKHAACSIESNDIFPIQNQSSLAQSVILGADLEQDIILLSEMLSDSKVSLDIGTRATLRLNAGSQFLFLRLSLIENSLGLSTWTLSHSFWSSNRRWHPRASFIPHQAPKVSVTREFKPNLQAELRDISAQGACLLFWNKDIARDFAPNQRLNPEIIFNECFHMRVDGRVLQSSFLRSPCGHTQLRMAFEGLSEVNRSQIDILVADMTASTRAA